MFKFINMLFLLCPIPLIISGCMAYQLAGKGEVKIVEVKKDSITVKPSGSYEECLALVPGQKMIYKFHSSRPVDFNVHYHGADEVHYPVSQSDVTEANGTIDPAKHDFYTKDQEYYCLMWESHDRRPANISYECTVMEK